MEQILEIGLSLENKNEQQRDRYHGQKGKVANERPLMNHKITKMMENILTKEVKYMVETKAIDVVEIQDGSTINLKFKVMFA